MAQSSVAKSPVEKRLNLYRDISSMCISAAHNLLSIDDLRRDYRELLRLDIDEAARDAGYSSLNECLQDIDGEVVEVRFDKRRNTYVLRAVSSEETRHLENLILRQKVRPKVSRFNVKGQDNSGAPNSHRLGISRNIARGPGHATLNRPQPLPRQAVPPSQPSRQSFANLPPITHVTPNANLIVSTTGEGSVRSVSAAPAASWVLSPPKDTGLNTSPKKPPLVAAVLSFHEAVELLRQIISTHFERDGVKVTDIGDVFLAHTGQAFPFTGNDAALAKLLLTADPYCLMFNSTFQDGTICIKVPPRDEDDTEVEDEPLIVLEPMSSPGAAKPCPSASFSPPRADQNEWDELAEELEHIDMGDNEHFAEAEEGHLTPDLRDLLESLLSGLAHKLLPISDVEFGLRCLEVKCKELQQQVHSGGDSDALQAQFRLFQIRTLCFKIAVERYHAGLLPSV